MEANDIKAMFEGIDDYTKDIIARKLKTELSQAITAVNLKLSVDGASREQLSPRPELIMNAFRLCSLHSVRVVLLGQDPYIKPGEATGLSFSVPRGISIPPSLKKIYECLSHYGLIDGIPVHGDLSNWATQGVLMLNAALTTVLKKSCVHSHEWEKYTNALLAELSGLPQQLIFIFLGAFAQEKAKFIDKRRHVILEWGHPSPLNMANKTDNPKNFKYCSVFSRANDMLILRGHAPINWDPNSKGGAPIVTLAEIEREPVVALPSPIRAVAFDDPVPPTCALWVFTDGGSSGNGKANCRSSWAFYITDGCVRADAYGVVESKEIAGEVYKSSNNRGELTAIYRALEFIRSHLSEFECGEINLVSDSEYSINCLNVWIVQWLADPVKYKLNEKKNLDIIVPAREILETIRLKCPITFKHINSHLNEPADESSDEWFLWKCNDIVDKLCNKALGR